ncbi:TetR/AcrR family transcriptional regulator [Pseudoglutamicibacter cumminsii]|uniref:TetR/AcrR family transcriptional regulator n=1 Tax=Pseudoglutamicibacter cumminsii TaxID=156979 RepID=UPI0034DF6E30
MAAACALLAECGFEATSPQMIQQRSGVGHGSMYHHFRGVWFHDIVHPSPLQPTHKCATTPFQPCLTTSFTHVPGHRSPHRKTRPVRRRYPRRGTGRRGNALVRPATSSGCTGVQQPQR